MRIWHQSLVARTPETEPYYRVLAEHAEAVCEPGTEVELHGLPPEVYESGLTPADLTSRLAGDAVAEACVAAAVTQADAEGYDAFAIAVLQEPGLQLARTLTDMPVVGYGQAAALVGRCCADRVGVLAFNAPLFALFEERLGRHLGAAPPIHDLGVGYDEVLRALEGGPLLEHIENGCRELVAAGASAIVPGQMLLAEVMWTNGINRIEEVPVIDGFGATLKLAEALHALRRTSGLTVSRRDVRWLRADERILDGLAVASKVMSR